MASKKKKDTETKYHKSLENIYQSLITDRQPYLTKALISASYTIPSLITDGNFVGAKTIETPNQSVGADGVNNLASKVTLTMLPPNQTFFKFSMDDLVIKQLVAENGEDEQTFKDNINKGLSAVEKTTLDAMEATSDRVCLGEAQKHLYVAGNVLLVYDPEFGLKYYPLNRYVIKRDYVGNLVLGITEESIAICELPEEVKDDVKFKVLEKKIKNGEAREEVTDDEEVTLYTCCRNKGTYWEVYQEIEGIELPESRGKYPKDVCPFIPLRYTRIEGESYGRGLIEEYIGDISYLDCISLAIKQASLAASKFIMLVNPQGITDVKKLASTPNGGFASGRAEDVAPLQANKYYDLQVAQAEADKIERRLNRIFVMKAAIQRDAERVTAEEIRQMAADLEEALGNHYAIMCKEFQMAYVKLVLFHLRKQKNKDYLPDILSDDSIKLTVTTGLEALSRSSDLNKMVTFFDIMGKFAPAIQQTGAKIDKIAQIVGTSLNLDTTSWFMSEEERQQAAQDAQNAQLINRAAPQIVNQYGEAQREQAARDAEQEQVQV